MKKLLIILALILMGAFFFLQAKGPKRADSVSSPEEKQSKAIVNKADQNKDDPKTSMNKKDKALVSKLPTSAKKSLDGSWEKVIFNEDESKKFTKKEIFQEEVLKEYPFLKEGLPEGVKIGIQKYNQTPYSNIVVWEYSYNGIPYPGKKVFFFRKDESENLGKLFQINNDVPLLLEFNQCNDIGEKAALKKLRSFHKDSISHIKMEKRYFPDAGQTASLGYEFTYEVEAKDKHFLVAIDACSGALIKGPLSIREH